MTNKEREILEIIKKNPTIEQSRIAEIMGISRSTVAVHISSLQKQGYISGKGYIVTNDPYIVGIGATNVDVYGKSRIPLRKHYDHPADIISSIGGVMHNIITDYSMLGKKAKIITAYGDDSYGKMILEDYEKNGIDIVHSLKVPHSSSGIFIQIQDENNDMHMAVCDMSVFENITPEFIFTKQKLLAKAALVMIDPSLKDETIEAIISICKGITPICIDPISDNFALKTAAYVQYFDFIKPNRNELANLSSMPVNTMEEVKAAGRSLLDKGLKKILVSLGKDGVLYMDEKQCVHKKFKEEKQMVNASGAGDALSAAFLYGMVQGLDIGETLNYCLAAGIAAIRSKTAINENMSLALLDEIIKESAK